MREYVDLLIMKLNNPSVNSVDSSLYTREPFCFATPQRKTRLWGFGKSFAFKYFFRRDIMKIQTERGMNHGDYRDRKHLHLRTDFGGSSKEQNRAYLRCGKDF